MALFVTGSAFTAGGFTAMTTLVAATDAVAQSTVDGGDADAHAGPCTFLATGGLPSSGSCTARVSRRVGSDTSRSVDVAIDGVSWELSKVRVWLAFDATPTGGLIQSRPAVNGPEHYFGHAEVEATLRVSF